MLRGESKEGGKEREREKNIRPAHSLVREAEEKTQALPSGSSQTMGKEKPQARGLDGDQVSLTDWYQPWVWGGVGCLDSKPGRIREGKEQAGWAS